MAQGSEKQKQLIDNLFKDRVINQDIYDMWLTAWNKGFLHIKIEKHSNKFGSIDIDVRVCIQFESIPEHYTI